MAGEQEQTRGGGEGERRRHSPGWVPTSPWSKGRPPVCPKNTCEFFSNKVEEEEETLSNVACWLLGAVLHLFMAPRRPPAQRNCSLFTGAK